MEAMEGAWLDGVAARLVEATGGRPAGEPVSAGEPPVSDEESPVSDEEFRLLLKIAKVTADATGIRYLAPVTTYLVGVAMGRAGEEAPGLRRLADAVEGLAAGWPRPEPTGSTAPAG